MTVTCTPHVEKTRERMLTLRSQGYSNVEISKAIGCSEAWVSKLLHEPGVKAPRRFSPKMSFAAIEEREQQVLRLHREGISNHGISRMMGIHHSTVGRILTRIQTQEPDRFVCRDCVDRRKHHHCTECGLQMTIEQPGPICALCILETQRWALEYIGAKEDAKKRRLTRLDAPAIMTALLAPFPEPPTSNYSHPKDPGELYVQELAS